MTFICHAADKCCRLNQSPNPTPTSTEGRISYHRLDNNGLPNCRYCRENHWTEKDENNNQSSNTFSILKNHFLKIFLPTLDNACVMRSVRMSDMEPDLNYNDVTAGEENMCDDEEGYDDGDECASYYGTVKSALNYLGKYQLSDMYEQPSDVADCMTTGDHGSGDRICTDNAAALSVQNVSTDDDDDDDDAVVVAAAVDSNQQRAWYLDCSPYVNMDDRKLHLVTASMLMTETELITARFAKYDRMIPRIFAPKPDYVAGYVTVATGSSVITLLEPCFYIDHSSKRKKKTTTMSNRSRSRVFCCCCCCEYFPLLSAPAIRRLLRQICQRIWVSFRGATRLPTRLVTC